MGRSLRLPSSTSSPSRNTIVRNPSHLGSKLQGPSGSSGTGLASIGATGGITGRSMHPVSAHGVRLVAWLVTSTEPPTWAIAPEECIQDLIGLHCSWTQGRTTVLHDDDWCGHLVVQPGCSCVYGNGARGRSRLILVSLGLRWLLGDDLHAQVDAFVADVDAGAGDQLLDLALVLTTKRARQGGGGLPRAGSAPADAEPHPLSFLLVLSLTVGGGRVAVGPGR